MLYAKFSKCEFWLKEVQFLGHVGNLRRLSRGYLQGLTSVHETGKTPDVTLKEIRSFLGLADCSEDMVVPASIIFRTVEGSDSRHHLGPCSSRKHWYKTSHEYSLPTLRRRSDELTTQALSVCNNLRICTGGGNVGSPVIWTEVRGRKSDYWDQKIVQEMTWQKIFQITGKIENRQECRSAKLDDKNVQVPLDEIEIDENLRFVEEPLEIVERDVKKLKRRTNPNWLKFVRTLGKECVYLGTRKGPIPDKISASFLRKTSCTFVKCRDLSLEDKALLTRGDYNSKEWNSSDDQLRLRWMIYLVVLADAAESVRDTIGFEYHSSIWCAPFEALYGMKCRSHVLWAETGESSLIGPELVQEMTDKVVLIKEKLKAARDRQKSYVDNRRKPLEFEVGDRVMLKVSPWKGVIRFGKKGKLAPRYVGPFEILERIGPVAYDTFHVSSLKKCLADTSLRVPLDEIKVDKTLRFVEEPVEIMDREVRHYVCRVTVEIWIEKNKEVKTDKYSIVSTIEMNRKEWRIAWNATLIVGLFCVKRL
ncbi:hypothetical protein Tco_0653793 [Tanacetum coccineum]|uniref:Tf2-1-like SH3-like domain-containing protein n=1 Tax=Tanacetum coccineum TaxID=301880 RepID=A0ABQ4X1E1_9ASTR